MKNNIAKLCLLAAAWPAAYAANFDAAQSGNWSDPATWGRTDPGDVPGASDTVRFSNGVVVDLTESATITSIGYLNSGETSFLNISGSGTVLTLTGNSQFWYQNRLDINIKDGAAMDASSIAWGGGGYSNIAVEDASFSGGFGELRGSTVGDGSFFTVKNSDGKTATATATSDWNTNPNAAGSKMTFEVSGSGSSIDMGGKTFRLEATAGEAALVVSNGGVFKSYFMEVRNNANAVNRVSVFGEGSTIAGQGNNTIQIGGNRDVALAENSSTSLTFGGFDESGKFVAAGASALTSSWEVRVTQSGSANFLIGESNLSSEISANLGDAIMAGKFTKTFEGTLMLDFSNVDTRFLSEGTYYVSLISSTESLLKGLSGDATFEDWLSVLQTKDGDGVNFERIFLSGDNKILYAEVSVVPEPSAFAAAFGLLAFVFALWRRRPAGN